MEFILDPLIMDSLYEEVNLLKDFFLKKFNYDLYFFILINQTIYEMTPHLWKKVNSKPIDPDEETDLLKMIIQKDTKLKNLQMHLISFIDNSKILVVSSKTIDDNDLYFIQKMCTTILMKNLYYDKVSQDEIQIKDLKRSLYFSDIELKVLFQLDKLYLEIEDSKILISKIIHYLLELTIADSGSIALLKDDRIFFYFLSENAPDQLKNIVLEPNEGIIGQAIAQKRIIIENKPDDSRIWRKDVAQQINYTPSAIIASPVFAPDKQVLGAVELTQKKSGFQFDESHSRLLTLFCSQLGKILSFQKI